MTATPGGTNNDYYTKEQFMADYNKNNPGNQKSYEEIVGGSAPSGQSGADDYFDINKFEQLLSKLEGSKGRQKRQESVEGRRDVFAQGLASMMSNF